MMTIIEKFNELGKNRDQQGLESLMNGLNEIELVNLIKKDICSSNFTETWNYILKSFKNTPQDHNKRINLVINLLNEFENRDLPQSRVEAILNRLNLELPHFKSNDLAKICNFCLEQIQTKKSIKFVWKDLLPGLLNVLVDRETFTYEDLDYTGVEYKTEFINTVCMSSWSPTIITPLTTLFIDMPLTKDEHLKVVNKLGSYIEKLTPQEIPTFIYQLLRLCKQQNGKSVFLKLHHYFNLRIHQNANNMSEDSPDSMCFDLIATDNKDTIEAESTVLYHIHTAASMGYECIKEYLNSLKNAIKAPEFILNPFQLMILFTISTIPHYEETVFEIIRPCIVRSYNEDQRATHSAWFREMVQSKNKPEEVLMQVIHSSLQDRDLVISGLVNFAFVLLEVGSALGRDVIAEKQWNLGNMILLKIIKRKSSIASNIIKTLGNHIVSRQSVSQYIECFYILSRSMPLVMLENQSCIIELIDCLVQLQARVADQLLDALIPLVKVSPNVRDHLIIYLRKALYSRFVDTRKIAVNGYLKLIKNLKISNMAALSQNSIGSFASGHSVFTQISINKNTQSATAGNFSNESLCLEILTILKRCFMQQENVRTKFYQGLYDVVCLNPQLCIPVLDLLWFHFKKYYVMEEDQLPPLAFDKIVVSKEAQMILEEPLGKLIHTIGLIVTKISELEDEKENITVVKFVTVLESLCRRMSNCELIHFELDDGTDLLDIIPESQKKSHILKEAMSTYEALLGYKIFSWNLHSDKQSQTVNSLFQGYNRLIHFSKSLSKPKKAESKKKNANKSTQPTQTQKKDSHKSANKSFKIPDTVWDFEIAKKALNLLYEPKLTWVTASEANVIKTKKELHQHVLAATLFLIREVKRRKDLETGTKKIYYDHITEVASLLFRGIVRRMNEFVDFDSATAVLALECFDLILHTINVNYKPNLQSFLSKIVSDDKNEDIVTSLTVIVEIYEKMFENGEEEAVDDPELKKISLIAVNTLSSLMNLSPNISTSLSVQMLDWLKSFAYNNTLTIKNSSSFINLLFEIHMKYKVSLTLFESISVSLGDVIGVITEEEHVRETFKIVNEASVNNILLSLCNSLKTVLEDIDAVVGRLKSEYYIMSYPGEETNDNRKENMKTKERGVCCQLCFVVTILTNLTNLLISPGNLSEAIFKNVISLFGTLSSLTKYFNTRSSKINLVFQSARFERLVKLAGKQLAPAIYKFIPHLEENQKESTKATQDNKRKTADASTLKSKVLRETRLLPKTIYEMEQFSKCIIQLSNKTKVDMSKYMAQGTVRDFRIMRLNEALNGENEGNESVIDVTKSSLDDSKTSNDESRTSHEESKIEDNERSEESADEESDQRPKKKVKR
ncbi:Fanconi anemia group I protein isoform X1 [Diorhabda sublineata]|uniref:Fanconi anemia group I protein isoform X1 n=2 Tax=Diorhabda sublineata TaxID=1163346 RepID=UPI0024E196D7|nr:Fanconi anemia group I protein isoform X1 [Diorhabda sublineata]